MTGDELVRAWQAFIARYCVLTQAQSLVLAFWAIHTWIFEKFGSTPYLEIYAASKGCGKTRILEALAYLVRGPEQMATARIAPMVRMIAEHQNRCTFLIDEAEKLAAGTFGETRSALAAGYRRGASHPVTTAQGVVRFPTYCPKAFALIGNIQPVLRDRSIPILLHRGTPSADLLKDAAEAREASDKLKADMIAFAQASGAFSHPPVEIPEWLYGRDAEIWTPLVSIALALKVHKATFEELQAASVDLSALKELEALPNRPAKSDDEAQAELDAAERVLADVQRVLTGADVAITTEDLLVRLRGIHTAPWRMWRGKGLDAITLAALLSRFGLGPENVQVGRGRKDRRIVKGYKASKLRAAKV